MGDMIVLEKIEPPLIEPVAACGLWEDDESGGMEWQYQYQISNPEFPGFTYNPTAKIGDGKSPRNIGDTYQEFIVTNVTVNRVVGVWNWQYELSRR